MCSSDLGDQHVAGPTGVLADHQRPAGADQVMGRGTAEGEGEGGLQVDVRDATNPVGAEEAGQAVPPVGMVGCGRGPDAAGTGVSWAPGWGRARAEPGGMH